MKTIQFILSCAMLIIQLSLSAQPIHAYELNNSYSDTYGGTDMAPNGGTLSSSSYVFQLGQGPSVSNVIDPHNYSIVMRFTPRHVDFWAKVLDFKNRTSDNGIYITDNRFMFYIGSPLMVAVGYDALFQDVPAVICLTRDGASKEVSGYVNGSLLWSFIDIMDEASFTGLGNIIQIGIDDSPNEPIPGTEHADGALNYFRIYDYVVTDPAIIFPDCDNVDYDCDGTANSCDICPGGNDNGPCYVSSLPPLHTLPVDWLCSNNNNSEKILICHDGATLCVSENAANAHLSHGDFLGPCASCPQNFSTAGSINNIVTATGLELMHSKPQEKLGIMSERMKRNEFLVFPNPASAEIHVLIPGEHQEGVLRILSLTGQEIHTFQLTDQQSIVIDLSDYASGLYVIDVQSASVHYQKKFVKL